VEERVRTLIQEATQAILSTTSTAELEAVETRYLGRKGQVTELLRALPTLPPEERPRFGQMLNSVKAQLQAQIDQRRAELQRREREERLRAERIDITLPPRPLRVGLKHPLTQTMERVRAALIGLGFEFVDSPELDDYRYNFAALNYPDDHPAMDEQMSFYVSDTRLLRTQTTSVQGRVMEKRKPPFRIAVIGRCFRNETVDATHHHTFHQVDAFMVDKGISMADLKGVLAAFARQMFGEDVQVRFRPDFFPFVEPGVDYAIYWQGDGWNWAAQG
jgi:phenylalanyl-tRNA synthetase alpha chain